ncbi:hypothetical protein J2X13_000766 [Aminobacter aminovorans]|nr:hypothetical protein [Aminobacter aminovorans]
MPHLIRRVLWHMAEIALRIALFRYVSGRP